MIQSLTATLDTQSNAVCRGGVLEMSTLTLYGSPGGQEGGYKRKKRRPPTSILSKDQGYMSPTTGN